MPHADWCRERSLSILIWLWYITLMMGVFKGEWKVRSWGGVSMPARGCAINQSYISDMLTWPMYIYWGGVACRGSLSACRTRRSTGSCLRMSPSPTRTATPLGRWWAGTAPRPSTWSPRMCHRRGLLEPAPDPLPTYRPPRPQKQRQQQWPSQAASRTPPRSALQHTRCRRSFPPQNLS